MEYEGKKLPRSREPHLPLPAMILCRFGILPSRPQRFCVIRTKWNADSGGSGTRNPEEVEYRFQEVEHEIREVERRIRRKWNIGSWDRERSSVA